MNPFKQNAFLNNTEANAVLSPAEETLRLIASLPVPERLAERVQVGLRARSSAASSKGRVLSWPSRPRLNGNWMRSAAAAAIVFVVVGGGWGVYSRVQPAPSARVIATPPRVAAPSGFSTGGARRTPQTLQGPVVPHPAVVAPQANTSAETATSSAQKTPRKKTAGARMAAGQTATEQAK